MAVRELPTYVAVTPSSSLMKLARMNFDEHCGDPSSRILIEILSICSERASGSPCCRSSIFVEQIGLDDLGGALFQSRQQSSGQNLSEFPCMEEFSSERDFNSPRFRSPIFAFQIGLDVLGGALL